MANFKIAYGKTNKWEGGYANVAGDNGGETYAGITRKNFPHWKGWGIVDRRKPLKNGAIISDSALEGLIHDFYKTEFWDKIGGDNIEYQELADQLYDQAVNGGVPSALKILKQS